MKPAYAYAFFFAATIAGFLVGWWGRSVTTELGATRSEAEQFDQHRANEAQELRQELIELRQQRLPPAQVFVVPCPAPPRAEREAYAEDDDFPQRPLSELKP